MPNKSPIKNINNKKNIKVKNYETDNYFILQNNTDKIVYYSTDERYIELINFYLPEKFILFPNTIIIENNNNYEKIGIKTNIEDLIINELNNTNAILSFFKLIDTDRIDTDENFKSKIIGLVNTVNKIEIKDNSIDDKIKSFFQIALKIIEDNE